MRSLVAAALALAACSSPAPAPTAAPPSPSGTSRPNILLLDVDSMRADALDPAVTPAMAGLAAAGTTFALARSPSGWTLPGLVGLLAGRPAEDALLVETLPEPLRAHLLPSILATYGYHVAYAWGDTLLGAHPTAAAWFGPSPERLADSPAVAARIATIDEPFFMLVHDHDLHPVELRVPLSGDHTFPELTPEFKSQFKEAYLRNARTADESVRAILAALDASGRAENTLVVLTSDHGESYGDHEWIAHGVGIYESVLRVPLAIRGPGIPGGRTVADAVSTTDIAPTLLAAAGIALDHTMSGLDLHPALLPSPSALPERTFYAHTNRVSAASIRGTHKVLIVPPECGDGTPLGTLRAPVCTHIYELADDPNELADRGQIDPAATLADRDALIAWLATQTDPVASEASIAFRRALRKRGYFETNENQPAGAAPREGGPDAPVPQR